MHRSTTLLISTAILLWAAGCFSPAPLANGVSLTIDGKKQAVRGSISCSSHSAGDAVKVGDLPDGIYIHISPELSGVSRIEELDLGNSTGKSLVGEDTKLTLKQDGTYHITGNAVPQDKQDSNAPKPFELNIKCP